MEYRDQTSMGGSGEAFLATDWTIVQEIAEGGRDHGTAVVNDLLKRYWKPVYCFLRHKGYDNEQAKDLTQSFFEEVVLGRDLIKRADRSRGRFRTFLLASLQQYLAGLHRKDTALKRTPPGMLIHIDQMEDYHLPASVRSLTAEESFNHIWLSELLDKLIDEVEARCQADGRALHWRVYYEKVLRPIMEDWPEPSMADVCSRCGIEEASKGYTMIATVNSRFRAVLKRHLRRSVASDDEVDDELRELMQVYCGKSPK